MTDANDAPSEPDPSAAQTVAVVLVVEDGRGKDVKILEPCWNHVLRRHKEFEGAEAAISLAISDPDMVIRPSNRPKGRGIDRRVNVRLGTHPRYNSLERNTAVAVSVERFPGRRQPRVILCPPLVIEA